MPSLDYITQYGREWQQHGDCPAPALRCALRAQSARARSDRLQQTFGHRTRGGCENARSVLCSCTTATNNPNTAVKIWFKFYSELTQQFTYVCFFYAVHEKSRHAQRGGCTLQLSLVKHGPNQLASQNQKLHFS